MTEQEFSKEVGKLAKGLSEPMAQMLRDISRYGDAFHSLQRRPPHGGATGTTQALFARGLIISLSQLSNLGAFVLLRLTRRNITARYYIKAGKRIWHVIDRTTGLPVYDNKPTGDDAPAIFGTIEAAQECAEYLNDLEE